MHPEEEVIQMEREPKWMSKGKWRETRAVIAQYDELVEEYNSIIAGEAVEMDGMPRGGRLSDPTASRAIKAERVKEKIDAIEKALDVIEEEYREGVFKYLTRGKPFPDYASVRTWHYKKREYIHAVAKKLMIT